eukprot:gene12794-14773_t
MSAKHSSGRSIPTSPVSLIDAVLPRSPDPDRLKSSYSVTCGARSCRRKMFARVILLLAFVGITLTKVDAESSAPAPRVKITPMAGAVVVDGFSPANNLTMPCNNKFCEMLKYTATCKSLALGMKKICAIHLLGYKYGCDAFPPASDVVKAPSICIPSALAILKPIGDNAPVALAAILGPYLEPKSFVADNCDRHCFQNFQYATHDFFSTCRPQLNKKIPIATLQSVFQEYRNQACSRNPNGQNCYASIMSLVSTPSTSTFSDLYAALQGEELSPEEGYMQAEMLEQFKELLAEDEPLLAPGSIEASIPAGLESPFVGSSDVQLQDVQDVQEVTVDATDATDGEPRRALQTGATNNIFNFLCNYTSGTTGYLPPPGPGTNYCTNGSIASNTVNRGTVRVPYLAPNNIPNMYVSLGPLTVQTAIQKGLAALKLTVWPYLFTTPLQIQIVDYSYGVNNTVAVTPTNGAMLLPYGSDYAAANKPAVGGFGLFTFQILNQDLNATTSAKLYQALLSPPFQQAVSSVLTGGQSGTAVKTTITQAPVIFEAKPFVFENAASSLSAFKGAQWLVTLGLTLGASVLLMKSTAV